MSLKFKYLSVFAGMLFGCIPLSSMAFLWTAKASFAPGNRLGAYSFSIGNNGYVGGGLMESGATTTLMNDCWKYDAVSNTWSQVASMPGNGRVYAAAFAATGKGYVTTGDDQVNYFDDTWEYDPNNNVWNAKAAYPGGTRSGTAAFAIGDAGFVGLGSSSSMTYYSDFYKYDATVDQWSGMASCPGGIRQFATGLSYNGYGYVLGGTNENTASNFNGFYRYDPVADAWSSKAFYPGSGAYGCAAFVFNNTVYAGTGAKTGLGANAVYDDFYAYDPNIDNWTAVPLFGGGVRFGAAFVTIGTKGYMGTGATTLLPAAGFSDDWWSFEDPTGVASADQLSGVKVICQNNAVTFYFAVPLAATATVNIYDLRGSRLNTATAAAGTKDITISLNQQTALVLLYDIASGTKTVSGKIAAVK